MTSLPLFKKTARTRDYLSPFNESGVQRSREKCKYRKDYIVRVPENLLDVHWEEYKTKYNKKYQSRFHERSALSTWRSNMKRVAGHNQEYLAGKQAYTLHLNHFGDWSIFSYIKQLLKLIRTLPLFDPAEDRRRTTYRNTFDTRLPERVDWREKGFRPRLEEQFHCGACYAFAITHAVQAQVYKRHGDWRELSPQQIVDCSFKDGNFGCDGGSLQAALRYVARDGLIRETYYPYIGQRGACHYNSESVSARVRRWSSLPPGDEAAMERALATLGPLAVAVNAAPFTFQLYRYRGGTELRLKLILIPDQRSGIYDDPFCVSWHLNHAMLLVGYTPEYWILLNWWGEQWGENGYMRIKRGLNICGVANMATYVEL
ncbi:cathepsin L proteinase precursor [Danaus plexippus plexippus]|uniref:Cathepsin L proteinase n=1 Tax=Danaus plexippus plexippus TaxID=278856 RepID=A0A212ESU6_DANPL|nr:cathepsin L proteinase precursor [Danaus plexippus plexippus]